MNIKAFTLVELIVVVTILGILATVGFVSYSWYLVWVRDANRIASLTSISDGLELYRSNHKLPLPNDYIQIESSGSTIAFQWYVWANVLSTIEYSKAGRDPKDNSYFSYYLTRNKKYYQLMALLEEGDNLEAGLNTTYAATDYSNRFPKVYGKRLWILTDVNNTPAQDIPAVITSKKINLTTDSDIYVANFSDSWKLQASATELGVLKDLTKTGWRPNNCLTWLLQNPELKGEEGIFTLTDEQGKTYNGFCDQVSNDWGYSQVQTANPENNFITNGDFATGDISTESGSSSGTNVIVDIASPMLSGKALHQTSAAGTSEYEIHFPAGTTLMQGDIIKMSAWVADTNWYIFHNRLYYSDGSEVTDGAVETLDSKIIDGKTWRFQSVKREITKTPTGAFNWYIGYNAEVPKDLYFTGVKLELFRK